VHARGAREVALAALVLVAGAAARAQERFPAQAETVSVDVAVVDEEGRPVEGLQATDFAVRVDGQPRPVQLARFVAAARAPAQGTDAAPSPSVSWSTNAPASAVARVFLLVLDREALGTGPLARARRAAAAFVRSLGPDDRVGLIGIPGATPLVDLTRDRERVAAALERPLAPRSEAVSQVRVSEAEAVDIGRRDAQALLRVVERECDLDLRNDESIRLERVFQAAESGTGCPRTVLVEARRVETLARERAVSTLRLLRDLVDALGRVDAPTRVVLVSGGFPGGPALSGELKELSAAAAAARVSVDAIQPSGPRFDVTDERPSPDWTTEARTLAEGPGRLADETGGAILRPALDPASGFERLSRERSAYYLLALEPRDSDRDGRPHAIEVKVSRGGAIVRARRQFVVGARPSTPEPAAAARALLASPLGAAELPVEAGTYVLLGEPGSLAVVAEVAVGPSRPAAAGSLAFALTDAAGAVVTQGERKIAASDGDTGPARVSLTFSLAPGEYSLRLAAVDARGRLGALEHPLRARLHERGGRRVSDLLLGDPSAPRGRQIRPFPTTRVAEIAALVEIGDEGTAEPPVVTFEVASGDDSPPLVRVAAQVTREAGRATADAMVPLGPLAAGEYVLRARVGDGTPVARRFRYEPKAMAIATPAATREQPAATELLGHVDAYLADYARRLGAVVAREDYVQREFEAGRRAERHLVSDLLLARLPGQPWVAYRDVAEVDGRPVRDRERRLERLLRDDPGDALRQAGRLADESARHNLGRWRRNLNAPTIVLALLDPSMRERVRIEPAGEETRDGRRVARLRVRERKAGVLVRTPWGEPVSSEASFAIDAETGAVLGSRLVVEDEGVRVTIEVDYRDDPGLGMLVPVEMREDYRRPPSSRLDAVQGVYRVDGVARYADYARAQVSIDVLAARPTPAP
jgi:VWFA-related protein